MFKNENNKPFSLVVSGGCRRQLLKEKVVADSQTILACRRSSISSFSPSKLIAAESQSDFSRTEQQKIMQWNENLHVLLIVKFVTGLPTGSVRGEGD